MSCVLLLLSCGGNERALLVLDLRTDFIPGVEFDRAEAWIVDYPDLTAGQSVVAGDDGVQGFRIAEIEGVPFGEHTVVVALKQSGAPVVRRRLRFRIRKTLALTAIISRDCRGVTCATGGSAAEACLGGRCVDDRCAPETPEFCPVGDCESSAECGSDIACGVPTCVEGICLTVADDMLCGDALVCNPDSGCVEKMPEMPLRAATCEEGETTGAFCALEGVVHCADGDLSVDSPCLHRCTGQTPHCATFVPSYVGDRLSLPDPAASADLVVGDDEADAVWWFDSDTGAIATEGGVVIRPAGAGPVAGVVFAALPLVGVRTGSAGVFIVGSLEVPATHTLRGRGQSPLLILSNTAISVDGTIDVGAGIDGDQTVPGPGGWPGVTGRAVPGQGMGAGGASTTGQVGGGGGAFGGPGGWGQAVAALLQGSGGVPYGNVELETLYGGSSGGVGEGRGSSGAGGGALVLSAAEEIVIDGRVGSPGEGGVDAGGGGAGGALFVEAPSVRFGPLAFLTANGGGGGAGVSLMGSRGSLSSASAPGGAGSAGEGSDSGGTGGDAVSPLGYGGGGGGGRIRIRTARGLVRFGVLPTLPDEASGLATEGRLRLE